MKWRNVLTRAKQKGGRVASRLRRAATAVPRSVAGELRYWQSLQSEVLLQRDNIRALEERCDALSARVTSLQREIASLRSDSQPASRSD